MSQHITAWACTPILWVLWTKDVSKPNWLWFCYPGYTPKALQSSPEPRCLHAELTLLYLFLQRSESWIPYALHIFRSYPKALFQGFLIYCEFYEPNQPHHFLEIEEKERSLRIKRNQHPIDPFYIHSNHLSIGIQEPCTIWLRCTQYMAT